MEGHDSTSSQGENPGEDITSGHQLGGDNRRRPRNSSRRPRRIVPDPRPVVGPLPPVDYEGAYFQSYANAGTHEEMIKDQVRTEAYRNAIFHYQSLIEGKVVLDVGCGTGILSIFCAQAGARRVYAVDASNVADHAKEIVKANNLSEIIVVLHERMEQVQLNEHVDVIVSDWMGYMLFYESMLRSVIVARDRWLKPGGLMLPSNAMLYMAPVIHPDRYAESVGFWRNVYGINMSPIMQVAKHCAFMEPSVETISGANVLAWPRSVKYVDCYTVTEREAESVISGFRFESMIGAPFHGFAFWFDVEFGGPANTNRALVSVEESTETKPPDSYTWKRDNPDAIVLSTAPEGPPTHWHQTIVYFYDPIDVEQNQVIEGRVTITQCLHNFRSINIQLEYTVGDRSFVKESVLE